MSEARKGTRERHTPGPWAIDLERPMVLGGDSREVYALTPDGRHVERGIATLLFDTDEYPDGPAYLEDVANARLIAAAPDLLAVVMFALSKFTDPEQLRTDPASVRLKEMGEAVLAKVKGGA